MAEKRAWGWNLEQMRTAGEGGSDMVILFVSLSPLLQHLLTAGHPDREKNYDAPAVSGFTPINRPQPSIPTGRSRPMAPDLSRPVTDTRGKAARKNSAEETTTPTKIQCPKRKALTIEISRERDISKDLPRTKPGQTGQCGLVKKTVQPSRNIYLPPIGEDSVWEDQDVTAPVQKRNNASLLTIIRPTSLVGRYQAAYSTENQPGHDEKLSLCSQTSSDAEFDIPKSLPRNITENSIRHLPQEGQAHSLFVQMNAIEMDFEPPQSAQPPNVALQESSEATEPFSPCAARVSDNWTEQQEPELSEGTIQDDEFGSTLEGWPDDVSISDAMMIHDDDTAVEARHSTDSQSSCILAGISGSIENFPRSQPGLHTEFDNDVGDFDDSDLESSLLDLTSPTKPHQSQTPQKPQQSSSRKLQWLDPKTFTPASSRSIVPIVWIDVPHLVPTNATGDHLPFARPPFPKTILDRSPILGLTNTTVLRTCFRIGEALNSATQASRSNTNAIIELYARISMSIRVADSDCKQLFQFADLFTDKPPYLSGTSTVWKGVGLWDHDCKVFLGPAGRGKMCRVVGRIKKGDGQASGCEMTVLSIWEVDWEDVGLAKGVVCS